VEVEGGVGVAGPLSGIRVIELGQVIAGPFCGQLLGDYGADVVKVEPPGTGDVLRQWGKTDGVGDSLWWSVTARNKRSVTVDLRTPEGQQLVRDLVVAADILVENFRPGTLERWGLGWADLSAIRPELIMVRISGFGQTGPYAQRAGYASVGEAMGGLRALTGYPDRPPVRVGISIGDSLTGMFGAMGALAALEARRRTGRGQVVDASIFESVLGVTESLVVDWQAAGVVRERTGPTLPGIAPSNVYPTRDGEVLVAANQDSVFRRLVDLMGRSELATDPRFVDHQARGRNMAEIDGIVAEWTGAQASSELLERLHAAGVPAGLVYQPKDMLDDPQFTARGSIATVHDERRGELRMQNVVPKLSETPGEIRWTGRPLGADTDEVLTELLGLTAEQVEKLRAQGVIGHAPDAAKEGSR
jgi:formyl-CoA transferase